MSDDVDDDLLPKSAPPDRAVNGPLDESEANSVRPYVDLGGLKILPREGLGLRLEIEEGTGRVVAVGLDVGESSLQVQPFAAPRSSGPASRRRRSRIASSAPRSSRACRPPSAAPLRSVPASASESPACRSIASARPV